MKRYVRFSYPLFEPLKKHHKFTGFMLVLICSCIFCAILAGIKFSNSSLLISFSNVTIVKFLRGTSGLGGIIFNNILTLSIFSTIIILSCYKKYTISIGIFFYAYYVYAQTLILIAFMLEYGIINTLVIAFCMLLCMTITIFLLLELFLICLDFQNEYLYFKSAFRACIPILIFISLTIVVQSLIFLVLRNYIIVLIY